MLRLLDLFGDSMIWIDHHKSSIDRFKEKTSREPKGIRNLEYAACELTWNYFHPKEEIPLLVKYLGMYDSFRHRGTKEETKTLQIQYAARMQFTCPEDFDDYFRVYNESPALLSYFVTELMDAGEKILEYVTEMAKESIKRGFDLSIKGKRFLTVNENRLNPSKFGIDHHRMGYDGFASFWYRPDIDGWEFSLYSDDKKTDVSLIAKEMGGGGHFGAAGFTLNNIEDFIIDHKINNPF
jgi:oligoribonuclease NrnB/cAMP/cGMP phosphodiesterase (DHH superfamily)